MDEQTKKRKLEELERTLAEELDQNVKTLGGSVAAEAARSQTVAGGPPAGEEFKATISGTQPQDDEVSLEDIDSILNEVDPSFQQSLDDLAQNIKGVEKDIQIAPVDLVDEEEGAVASAPGRTSTESSNAPAAKKKFRDAFEWFLAVPRKIFRALGAAIERIRNDGVRPFLRFVLEKLPEVKEALLKALGAALEFVQHQFRVFRSLKRSAQWFLLLFLICVLGVAAYLKIILSGDLLHSESGPEFLSSFVPVADRVVEYSENDPLEEFDNPVRNPDFTVLVKRVVANVRSSAESGEKPMVAFQVFLEASSQEAAIEIKKREREVSDYLARVAENLTYDEWRSEDGKNRFRTLARRRINEVLNNGRVQKIYFKTVFYKP